MARAGLCFKAVIGDSFLGSLSSSVTSWRSAQLPLRERDHVAEGRLAAAISKLSNRRVSARGFGGVRRGYTYAECEAQKFAAKRRKAFFFKAWRNCKNAPPLQALEPKPRRSASLKEVRMCTSLAEIPEVHRSAPLTSACLTEVCMSLAECSCREKSNRRCLSSCLEEWGRVASAERRHMRRLGFARAFAKEQLLRQALHAWTTCVEVPSGSEEWSPRSPSFVLRDAPSFATPSPSPSPLHSATSKSIVDTPHRDGAGARRSDTPTKKIAWSMSDILPSNGRVDRLSLWAVLAAAKRNERAPQNESCANGEATATCFSIATPPKEVLTGASAIFSRMTGDTPQFAGMRDLESTPLREGEVTIEGDDSRMSDPNEPEVVFQRYCGRMSDVGVTPPKAAEVIEGHCSLVSDTGETPSKTSDLLLEGNDSCGCNPEETSQKETPPKEPQMRFRIRSDPGQMLLDATERKPRRRWGSTSVAKENCQPLTRLGL